MSFTEFSISDVAGRINAAPAPVLFPDTCALLDLIRMPFRLKSARTARQMLEAAIDLAAQSQTSTPDLWVVVPPLIFDEWNTHRQKVVDELRRHWSKLDTMIEVAHVTADILSAALPSAVVYAHQGIESALATLSGDFFNSALFLAEDSTCKERAYARVINEEAPARKGGQLKDCAVIEHVIELCSQLRARGFSNRCVFITSNTKDFCKEGRRSTFPREPLDSQLSAVDLSLTTNWQWTKAELGI